MRFVPKRGAMWRIRNSPEVVADIAERARRIAQAAGDGVETRPPETRTGMFHRARAAIVTTKFGRVRRLLSALDAGRR